MPWLEHRPNGRYHIAFRLGDQKLKKSLRTSDLRTAEARLHQLEENIRLLDKGRIVVPEDADLLEFLLSDGKLDGKTEAKTKLRTLKQFGDAFMASIPEGSLEAATLKGMEIHLNHLYRVLKKSFPLITLTLGDLQGYVDSRSQDPGNRGRNLSPATIKKELTTLRTLWNWARNAEYLTRAFPSRGLRYPKSAEKPLFQTWAEITRKIETQRLSEDQQADLWECLFLTTSEIEELLADVEAAALHPCLFPMFVFAAHTGARRSEIMRSQVEDIDLVGRMITIREKKRVRGRYTTRTVPISPALYGVLYQWLDTSGGIGHTFSLGLGFDRSKKRRETAGPLTRDEAHDHFKRTLAGTKWSPIRGWHVFRHSFCSNCAAAGIDQRVINAWVGHQTEEMVKRYRHLIPNQQQEAIKKVFETASVIDF
ncbi:MAG: site-specific integrase [Pirellulales bacterium]